MAGLTLPHARRWRIANLTAPACLVEGAPAVAETVRLDMVIEDGRIAALGVDDAVTDAQLMPSVDADRAMAFPCFIEAHTHLDKGHIWPRAANPDGTFPGALATVGADRAAHWRAADVAARMEFGLKAAYAYGTAAIRTHIDSPRDQMPISWPVFAEKRAEWAGRIELQGSSLIGVDMAAEPGYLDAAAATAKRYGGLLGCVTYMSPALPTVLDRMFALALAKGLVLDFHVDETLDPGARSLAMIAEAAIARNWRANGAGTIVVGHCCSLSTQTPDDQESVMDKVAEAGLAVVSLPMCNMYLQDRVPGRTPRRRGVTLLHELKRRSVPVMVSSDNTRDPFYAYGDLDAFEVYREATRILHLDHPIGDWPRAITATPAAVCGFPQHGLIRAGGPADLVIFRGRDFSEILSRPESGRLVIRGGRALAALPPDYRELDALFA